MSRRTVEDEFQNLRLLDRMSCDEGSLFDGQLIKGIMKQLQWITFLLIVVMEGGRVGSCSRAESPTVV